MYTQEQKLEAYRKLPEEIKEVVSSLDTVKAIKKIGEKNQLHVDQVGQLMDEVGLTVFGLTETAQFSQNIQNNLHLPPEQAAAITSDINQEIFLKIRQALQNPQVQAEPKAAETIFEQKVAKVFNLTTEKSDAQEKLPKPWEQDPYLERP